LLIAPLSPEVALGTPHRTPAALILITDLDGRPELLGGRLVDLFGLTPAEADLALALAGAPTRPRRPSYRRPAVIATAPARINSWR
jgi:hypothetical protein